MQSAKVKDWLVWVICSENGIQICMLKCKYLIHTWNATRSLQHRITFFVLLLKLVSLSKVLGFCFVSVVFLVIIWSTSDSKSVPTMLMKTLTLIPHYLFSCLVNPHLHSELEAVLDYNQEECLYSSVLVVRCWISL